MGSSKNFFKGASIIDLGFQLGIGIDVEPLLQEQEGMIDIVAFRALVDQDSL